MCGAGGVSIGVGKHIAASPQATVASSAGLTKRVLIGPRTPH